MWKFFCSCCQCRCRELERRKNFSLSVKSLVTEFFSHGEEIFFEMSAENFCKRLVEKIRAEKFLKSKNLREKVCKRQDKNFYVLKNSCVKIF